MHVFQRILDLVYPPKCPSCKTIVSDEHSICLDCYNNFEAISEPCCDKCSLALPSETLGKYCHQCIERKRSFAKNISVFRYSGFVKDLIHDLKYNNATINAKFIACIMYERNIQYVKSFDYLIPVPISNSKLIKRKYNHAQLIAKHISKLSKVPMYEECLKRKDSHFSQIMLNRVERYENLKDAFFSEVSRNDLYKMKVLLIDDVMTTGATIDMCAKALSRKGALSVSSLTFARTYS
jgi:competence protein ComFC